MNDALDDETPPVISGTLRKPKTQQITGEIVFLGTGTSVGVPALGCDCAVCTGGHPRDQRTRCALVLGLPEGNLLIDTPPDLRTQLLREGVGIVHAVAYTHSHADHLFGLDDLRLFPFYLGHPVPLFCEESVERRIRHSYNYAFFESPVTHPGARPQLETRLIDAHTPFQVLGATVTPLRLHHGSTQVLGFRIGDFAYCTDTNEIPDESLRRLEGVHTFVIDALRRHPHPTHFSLDEAIAISRQVGARRTLLTHVSHDLGYADLQRELPPGVELAYDGLRLPLTGHIGKMWMDDPASPQASSP